MGLYARYLFPALMDWVLRGDQFGRERARHLQATDGDILEWGFGTGLNVSYYPSRVSSLSAVDPALLLPRLVRRRIREARMPIRFTRGSAEHLPYRGGQFDCIVSTFTLCTIDDPVAALREAGRVIKSDGRLFFLEHGLSDDATVAKWQHRLTPIQKIIGCGCRLNRPISRLIEEAGWRIELLERYVMPGVPRIGGELYRGTALHGRL